MQTECLLSRQSDDAFALSGNIDFNNVNQLYEIGIEAFEKQKTIFIDLGHIHKSDSSGLALLVAWIRYANQMQKQLHFKNMPSCMYHFSRVCGVDSLLPISAKGK